MTGDTFPTKAPKEFTKRFVVTLKGNNFLTRGPIFLECSLVVRGYRCASIEMVSSLKLL